MRDVSNMLSFVSPVMMNLVSRYIVTIIIRIS
jgi:hypothetical protein